MRTVTDSRHQWLLPTVCDGVHHTPPHMGRFFHGRSLHTWNYSVGAQNVDVGKSRRLELFEAVSFGIWHPLGCRAIELGKPPQGGVIFFRVAPPPPTLVEDNKWLTSPVSEKCVGLRQPYNPYRSMPRYSTKLLFRKRAMRKAG